MKINDILYLEVSLLGQKEVKEGRQPLHFFVTRAEEAGGDHALLLQPADGQVEHIKRDKYGFSVLHTKHLHSTNR